VQNTDLLIKFFSKDPQDQRFINIYEVSQCIILGSTNYTCSKIRLTEHVFPLTPALTVTLNLIQLYTNPNPNCNLNPKAQ